MNFQLFNVSVLIVSLVYLNAKAQDQGHRPPPRMNLTAEQQACLDENRPERPADGERPSREEMKAKMDAIFEKCNIEKPSAPPEKRSESLSSEEASTTFDNLVKQYQAATTDEDKARLRQDIKDVFFATNDSQIKSKVREFLKNNPENFSVYPRDRAPARRSAGVN